MEPNSENDSFVDFYLEGNLKGWVAVGFSMNTKMVKNVTCYIPCMHVWHVICMLCTWFMICNVMCACVCAYVYSYMWLCNLHACGCASVEWSVCSCVLLLCNDVTCGCAMIIISICLKHAYNYVVVLVTCDDLLYVCVLGIDWCCWM